MTAYLIYGIYLSDLFSFQDWNVSGQLLDENMEFEIINMFTTNSLFSATFYSLNWENMKEKTSLDYDLSLQFMQLHLKREREREEKVLIFYSWPLSE